MIYSHLRTSDRLQIPPLGMPIDLPPQVIPRMHHLMRHRVLDPAPALEQVGAQLDAEPGIEAAEHALVRLAAPAADVALVQSAAELVDVGVQEADDGRVFQQVVALGLAAAAVDRLVAQVHIVPVGLLAPGGHGAAGHAVEVAEARPRISAGEEFGGAAFPGVGGLWRARIGLFLGSVLVLGIDGRGRGWWEAGGHDEVRIERERKARCK